MMASWMDEYQERPPPDRLISCSDVGQLKVKQGQTHVLLYDFLYEGLCVSSA